jgi:hypothetical protein
MPSYSGKFQYLDAQGACQLTFDQETLVVTPSGSTHVAFDLGDFDQASPGDWELSLTAYSGRSLVLRQFGAAFETMSTELLEAWRNRTVRCLLLEDLDELGRYSGAVNGAPAEIRIFKSNLAVLPQSGAPVRWRLADIDTCAFDDALTRPSSSAPASASCSPDWPRKPTRSTTNSAAPSTPSTPTCLKPAVEARTRGLANWRLN